MNKTSYQVPELRDANNDVVQEGAFGKNTALSNAENTGWIDYVMNDLEALHDTIGDSAATLDGNGHVVEPCNLAIGDEDGNRIKTNYLKLSGGTVAGTVNIAQNLKMQDNQENVFGGVYIPASSASQQYAQFYGGETPATTGTARLTLYSDEDNHSFTLTGGSTDGSTDYVLTNTGTGALTWRGSELAYKNNAELTGNPTAPTQATNNNSTRIATTAYVINDLKFNVPLLTDGFAETITSGADLNDYTTAGTYRTTSASVSASLENCPVTNYAFKLFVCPIGYGSVGYLMQIIITGLRSIYIRNATNSSATAWSGWSRLARAEDVLPLSGGTMSGAIIAEEVNPSSYATGLYRVRYTGIDNGTAPSSTRSGYAFRLEDSSGDGLGGIQTYIYNNGSFGNRLISRWGEASITLEEYISSTPAVRVLTDNGINLGGSNYRWKQLFAGTTTISTSDERLKTNITAIPNEVLDAWGEVNWYQFQFLDAWQEKGNNARIHTGAIAQRIKSVFEAHNLDPFRYGLLCYDEWDATPAERDEDGNITNPAQPAGNRYSLRYEEALCLEAAYQRRRADRLEERIARLEQLLS